jgi:hypothetical protein
MNTVLSNIKEIPRDGRETVDITLVYNNEGKLFEKIIPIFFTCNAIISRHNEFDTIVEKAKEAQLFIKVQQAKIATIKDVNEIKKINDEIEQKAKDIEGIDFQGFFKQRFELIKIILKQNGITEEDEPELYNYDFWDMCVNPADLNDFLAQCVYKDASKKKALVEL